MSKDPVILLVDDEPGVIRALSLVLGLVELEVIEAGGAQQAVDILRSAQGERISLILSDLRMPIHDGIWLLSAIREVNPSIPFVLMSGHAGRREIEEATRLGADAFIAKPFAPEEIHRVILELLESGRRRQNRDT